VGVGEQFEQGWRSDDWQGQSLPPSGASGDTKSHGADPDPSGSQESGHPCFLSGGRLCYPCTPYLEIAIKPFLFGSISIFLLPWITGTALATSVQYSIDDVAFEDGGTATGTFVYDTDLDEITDWSVSVSGGNEDTFPPLSYTPESSTIGRLDFGDLQPSIILRVLGTESSRRALRITPTLPLAQGGEIPLQLGTAGGGVECFNCFPSRSVISGSLITEDLVPVFSINPGLNGSWLNPGTPGQGFFVDVFPEIQQIFFAWFTYDTALPDAGEEANVGYSGHRWLTAQGGFAGDTATLEVFLSADGLFDDPRPTTADPYGTIRLIFTSCTEGTLEYDFPGPDVSGTLPMGRVFNDPINIELCDTLNVGN
jgi:hypothetical protein